MNILQSDDKAQIPLGLGMALAQDTNALNNFASLDLKKQQDIIQYVQASVTGDDAKERINKTVSDLKDGSAMM